MSGTNHAENVEWGGPQPLFILVGAQMGENIGASARAMWNFGLEHMRLVAPRDGWPNPKATALASGAARVLDQVSVAETTPEAVSDMTYVMATTARSRDLTKDVLTPERAMERSREMISKGQKVAILFGPERAGLENDDIARADALISVPVNPAFGSLNLAQSVLLLAYEWRRQTTQTPPEEKRLAGTEFATGLEAEKLYERMDAALSEVGFFWPEDKAESMRLTLRNMLSRLPMTQADVRTMHGVIKALSKDQNTQ